MDEAAALRNLDDRLRSVPQPNGSRMAERERRLRLDYLDGAEEVAGDDRTQADERFRPRHEDRETLVSKPFADEG